MKHFPARNAVGVLCLLMYWGFGHGIGAFYPFSPMGMFKDPDTSASRLVVRDETGTIREIVRFIEWECEGPLEFRSGPDCPTVGYSAYDEIVRNWIVSSPVREPQHPERVTLEICRRVFRVGDPLGPLLVTDCPIQRCTARPKQEGKWARRL